MCSIFMRRVKFDMRSFRYFCVHFYFLHSSPTPGQRRSRIDWTRPISQGTCAFDEAESCRCVNKAISQRPPLLLWYIRPFQYIKLASAPKCCVRVTYNERPHLHGFICSHKFFSRVEYWRISFWERSPPSEQNTRLIYSRSSREQYVAIFQQLRRHVPNNAADCWH